MEVNINNLAKRILYDDQRLTLIEDVVKYGSKIILITENYIQDKEL